MPKLSKITPLTRNEIFLNKIANGGDDVVTGETLNVTKNGKYTPSAENKVITEVNVNVPTSGGGGGSDTRTVKVLVKTNTGDARFIPTYGKIEVSTMGSTPLPGPVYISQMEALPAIKVNNNEYLELEAPENGGIIVRISDPSNITSVTCSENATTLVENDVYYFPSDGEINIIYKDIQ